MKWPKWVIDTREKWNPYTETGEDLDNIGKLCGLERDFDTWITESDKKFRERVLEEIKIILDK